MQHARRLITLATIRAEKIDRSRSWILGEMAAGRFPEPLVKGNPNLWEEAQVDTWLEAFVANARTNDRNRSMPVRPVRSKLAEQAASKS